MSDHNSDPARRVMQLANEQARQFYHGHVGTEHILLALLKERSGVAAEVLDRLGVTAVAVTREVYKIGVYGSLPAVPQGWLPHTPRAKKVIEYSIEESHNLDHNYVGTEHLLLGLLREEEGAAAQILMILGVTIEAARAEVVRLRPPGFRREDVPEATAPAPQPGPNLLREEHAQALRDVIEELNRKKESFVLEQDFEQAARCRDAARTLERVLAQLQPGQ